MWFCPRFFPWQVLRQAVGQAMSGQKKSDPVWTSSGSRPDLVPVLSTPSNPNPRKHPPSKHGYHGSWVCNPAAGSRVGGFQRCNVIRHCSKDPGFQDYIMPQFQGAKVGSKGFRLAKTGNSLKNRSWEILACKQFGLLILNLNVPLARHIA